MVDFRITLLDDDKIAFTLFNDNNEDKWEVGILQENKIDEYYIPASATGLIFDKKSVKKVVNALYLIAHELEQY
jgi:hypothetical protein